MRCSTRASNTRMHDGIVAAGVRRMSIIEFEAELVKAGAMMHGRFAHMRYLARRYPLGAAGAAIMGLFVFAAAFADFLTVYDPLSTNAANSLAPPGGDHWLGADHFGRDVYS